MGAKLDLDPRAQANAVLRQVLIHLLLAVKLCGSWIEIHVDPGAELEPLPFLLRRGFSFACIADSARFAFLCHC